MRFAFLLVFAASNAVSLFSQSSSQAPAPAKGVSALDQATSAQVREYLLLLHVDQNVKMLEISTIKAARVTSAPYIPASFWDDMENTLSTYDFITEVIPIYQAHLSRTDMEGALAFYRTDAGKHLLANQQTMVAESQQHFREIGRRLGAQVGERHASEIDAAKKKYEADIAAKHDATPR